MHIARRKVQKVKKLWGEEKIFANTKRYCGKILTIEPGFQCSLHAHSKDESFYILEGTLELQLGKGARKLILPTGSACRIRPNIFHRFKALNGQRCVFVEASTPHKDSDVVRLEDSRRID